MVKRGGHDQVKEGLTLTMKGSRTGYLGGGKASTGSSGNVKGDNTLDKEEERI